MNWLLYLLAAVAVAIGGKLLAKPFAVAYGLYFVAVMLGLLWKDLRRWKA